MENWAGLVKNTKYCGCELKMWKQNNWIFELWGVQRLLGRYCVLSSVSHNELVVIGLLNNETSVIEFINSRRFMSNELWVAPDSLRDSVRANDNPDMSLDNLLKLWLRIPGTMRLKNDQISMQQYLGNGIKILKTICIWYFFPLHFETKCYVQSCIRHRILWIPTSC